MRLPLLALALALGLAAPPALAGPPPRVAAEAYLVQNGSDGEVLARYDDAQRLSIASITKLMTVLVALERAKPGDIVTVPASAVSVGESTAHLRAGEKLTVRDLVEAAMIQSANDATYALAHHISGGDVDAFVELMNARARSLGLTDTHFARPDGLDAPGHYSRARDLTKLARVAMRRTVIRELADDRRGTLPGGRVLRTWNDLLSAKLVYPVVGVKTGHTTLAGWCQVAAARHSSGFLVYATILGSPTRAQRNEDLQALLSWGIDRYVQRVFLDPSRTYATAATQYGRGPLRLVPAGAESGALVNRSHALREVVVAPRIVALPVRQGQPLGEVRVYDGRKLLLRRPLVAAQSIAKPGRADRARWHAGRALSKAWSWLS